MKVGDKEPAFVGSKEWIGSFEVSTVLNQLLGVRDRARTHWNDRPSNKDKLTFNELTRTK